MKAKRRWTRLNLAMAVTVSLLSGCGQDVGTTQAEESGTQEGQEQTEEVSEAESGTAEETAGASLGQGGYIPGEYSASSRGFGGDVTVTIVMDENQITECRIEGPEETDGVGSRAVEELPEQILAAQSAGYPRCRTADGRR